MNFNGYAWYILPSTALGYDLEVMGTNMRLPRLSPANRRVVNHTYSIQPSDSCISSRPASFVGDVACYLFTYTYIGHWEHSIDQLQQHTLSLSLDVSAEKSVALYIMVMGRLKVYTSFGKRDHWICHLKKL